MHCRVDHIILFVDMDEDDDFNEFTSQDLIHIHKVNRRGRKCETKVTGIPEIFDYKKILKFWKNVSHQLYRIFKQMVVYARKVSKAERIRTAKETGNKKRTMQIRESRSSFKEITENVSKNF